MKHEYYVYMYADPFAKLPFYVGIGKGNRYLRHMKEAKKVKTSDGNMYKINKIRKILRQGKEPIIIKLLEGLSRQTACELEIKLIAILGRKGKGCLTNMTDGGDGGNTIATWTEEAKAALYKAQGAKRTGKRSKEWVQAISDSLKGREVSEETRLKMSATRKQRKIRSVLPEPRYGDKHHAYVAVDMTYVLDAIRCKKTLKQIAAEVGLTYNMLSVRVRNETGKTYSEWKKLFKQESVK